MIGLFLLFGVISNQQQPTVLQTWAKSVEERLTNIEQALKIQQRSASNLAAAVKRLEDTPQQIEDKATEIKGKQDEIKSIVDSVKEKQDKAPPVNFTEIGVILGGIASGFLGRLLIDLRKQQSITRAAQAIPSEQSSGTIPKP